MKAVYLTPRSIFPETLPSNTLFGAICRSMAELGYDPSPFIGEYPEDPPALISSAFPFILAGEGPIHYFPMPVLPPARMNATGAYDRLKRIRKIRYLEQPLFEQLVSGKVSLEELSDLAGRSKSPSPGFLGSKQWPERSGRQEIEIPHNRINRLSSVSEECYHTQTTAYRNGGLFFLLDIRNDAWTEPILAAIRYLEDRGIGPRVSAGQGQFCLSMGDLCLKEPEEAPYRVTLSRFIPRSLALFGREIWYDLVSVRGRTMDGMMKRGVVMLAEGAVYRSGGPGAAGLVPIVRDRPVMVEYGMAFPVRFRWSG